MLVTTDGVPETLRERETEVALGTVIARWGGRLERTDLGGQTHHAVFEGPEGWAPGPDPAPVVLVHGLGGHLMNWVLLADELRTERPVYAVDLGGHGLTRAGDRSPGVGANAQLVRRFVDEVVRPETGAQEVLLVGNSMGGLICSLLAERDPAHVAGIVLLDPALPAPRSRPDAQVRTFGTLLRPAVGRALRQRRGAPLSLEAEVERVLRTCFGDWQRMDREALEAHYAVARAQVGFDDLAKAQVLSGRTMVAALGRHGTVAARLRGLPVPTLLVHGTLDRLVDVSAARWAAKVAPRLVYEELSGVGHVPMLEVPEHTAGIIRGWERAWVR